MLVEVVMHDGRFGVPSVRWKHRPQNPGYAGKVGDGARVRQFQFRDIRPKAASEIGDVMAASKLLGHTEQEITKKVYIRVGETVKPTR